MFQVQHSLVRQDYAHVTINSLICFFRCWVCRRIGSTEARCSRPDASTDAKQLLPSITLAVSALDKELQELKPEQMSNIVDVNETSLGLTLQNLSSVALVVSGVKSEWNSKSDWSVGDVIIGCNGLIVQSKADLKRAMRFCESQTVTLDVIAAKSIDCKAPLSADWVRKETAGGRFLYENVQTHHVSWLHPELQLKKVTPLLVALASYQSGECFLSRT
jgi:hypothetical protein